MIEGLLQLSSVTRGEFEREPVDLSALSRTVVTELQALTPGRRVDVRIEEGLSDWAHPALAAIVLQNLIGNAWKFTGKTASPRIDIGRTRSAEGDSFCVRDNGVGFDPAGVTDGFKLFQRFHSREEFEGSGIGLATVERIILRHGGRIRVESAPGKGAAFYFSFGPPRSFPTTDRTASGPDSLVR
jgi:light-regulated signal transduction histidine kinase (bacteriophytochrome)